MEETNVARLRPAPMPYPTNPIVRQRPPMAKVLPILASAQRQRDEAEDEHGPSPYATGRGDLADELLESLEDEPARWDRTTLEEAQTEELELLVPVEDPVVLRARRLAWWALAAVAWSIFGALLLVLVPVVATAWFELWP